MKKSKKKNIEMKTIKPIIFYIFDKKYTFLSEQKQYHHHLFIIIIIRIHYLQFQYIYSRVPL